jgi:hypothetical protein
MGLTRTMAVAAALGGLAACSPAQQPQQQTQQQPAAADTQNSYEMVLVTGSATANEDLIKINTSTGASAISCCGNNSYTAITEPAPLPTGKYVLKLWNTIGSDNGVTWAAYRFDENTGRTWGLFHDNGAQYHWGAISN